MLSRKVTIDLSTERELTLAPATKLEAIEQSLYVLVNTLKGEVPCYREFGVTTAYMHRPANIAKTMFASAITAAIDKFIPEITVQKISFDAGADSPDTLKPIVEVVIRE